MPWRPSRPEATFDRRLLASGYLFRDSARFDDALLARPRSRGPFTDGGRGGRLESRSCLELGAASCRCRYPGSISAWSWATWSPWWDWGALPGGSAAPPQAGGGEGSHYFLAGNSLGWPVIGLAMFAAKISTVHLVSFAETAYKYGLVYGNFEWMAGFVLILLSLFFAPLYLRSRVPTLPDFLEGGSIATAATGSR